MMNYFIFSGVKKGIEGVVTEVLNVSKCFGPGKFQRPFEEIAYALAELQVVLTTLAII